MSTFGLRAGALQSAAVLVCCSLGSHKLAGQVDEKSSRTYTLSSTVSEVEVTFHATDKNGLPINDLKQGETRVYDDGVLQNVIYSFYQPQDRPIHAGILVDTSESMTDGLTVNRKIATEFVQRILRPAKDQAFVEDFGYGARLRQGWSGNSSELTLAIQNGIHASDPRPGGTALFQTLFQACYSEFGKPEEVNAKLILLFTDGEDNASHTDMEEALQMCQQSNTAIYAFEREMGSGNSSGPRNLVELTQKTGGRLFHAGDSTEKISNDLDMIEKDARNQYFLSFHPSTLKHDGSFHHLELLGPDRVDKIEGQSGYYDRKIKETGPQQYH